MNRVQEAWKALTHRSSVNLAGANNLFGTLGARSGMGVGLGSVDFLPTDAKNGIMMLRDNIGEQAAWKGLSSKFMQHWAYLVCSPVAAVIDRLAEADTNGRVEFINTDGTTRTSYKKNPKLNRIWNLMNNPNPMQTREEFNTNQLVICKIFGYCPVIAVRPAGMDNSYTTAFWNVNPVLCTPERNENFDIYLDPRPIKNWKVRLHGKEYNVDPEDMIIVKDGFLNNENDNLGLPISRLEGLDYFVSNICAAMEADNVLLRKKGPLGAFTYDPKPDMAGWTPMTPAQRREVQESLNSYGLSHGQNQYAISPYPIKWNAMSFNVRDLMTKETVRQSTDSICDRMNYPAELMSGKNATYENRSSAEKFLYQNNIIPFSLRRMACFDTFFGLGLDDVSIILDYDHLPVLQENVGQAGLALKATTEAVVQQWTSGLITWNQIQERLDQDTVSGMDIYYPEWFKKFGADMPQPQAPAQQNNQTAKNETTPSKDTPAAK